MVDLPVGYSLSMDRKVQVEVIDELVTLEANEPGAEVQVNVNYSRHYHPRAVQDGAEEWRDCLEGLAEAIAMTIADNLQDYDLSRMAAERISEVIVTRVQEFTKNSPLRSKPHAHIPGAMNVH